MTFRIRPEEPTDAEAIRGVHLSAFPSPLEADLVDRLRRDGDLVISLVAERQRETVGHVALSRMTATAEDRPLRALGLGPIGVHRTMQGGGAGAALVEAAKVVARTTGEELIFVLGEPEYYRRFGFSAARPFESPYSGPYFMALPLQPGSVPPRRGQAQYAPGFGALSDQA